MKLIPYVALVSVLALAACDSGAKPSAEPSGPRAGGNCEEAAAGGRAVHFGSEENADLYGLVFGDGPTGIVISHMNGGDVCQGMPYAKELAGRGYRALVFDFAGFGASPGVAAVPQARQVVAAATFLRKDGAANIVLIGGSMGATASVAAAPQLTPPPKAVVSLSAPLSFGADNALGAAGKMPSPVFYSAGEYESTFAESAKQLYDATPAGVARTLQLGEASSNHGLWLTDPTVGVQPLRAKIAEFLTVNAPAA
ncbi:MAG: alpha/beta fold hydrolase [Hamadaea sp.]|uniref:alpha/beta hydrolase n=1 Tax=Hamadaea sp. TaxID=2024425 RepID=UPI0017E2BDA7|nr:alpha/beta fold hydrolase [Hamadaea sp.]NUR71539.1 alpha/beta fold hydrolase [Hamadaea sp.]NUT19661.1 alpha/beta fold hydrolase [Hamadaea sp.]